MPATLIPSAGCCTVDDLSVTSAVPGPQGPAGAAGTNGTNGEDAFTTTSAQFTVPAVGANVTLTLTDASFVPQISNGAELYLSVGNAGYFKIVSKSGNDVVVTNPTLASANAAPTTVIALGAIVTVSGPPGADGADAAGGAPDTATYIIQTANGSLGSAQVLGSLASGYVKVTTTTGVLSSVTGIPVADVTGNWNLSNTTGTLAVARGGTNITSYTVGDLVYASGATTLASLADVATGNVLRSGGVGAPPAYGKVNLTTDVTGVLPVANGGSGAGTTGLVRAYASGGQNFAGTSAAVVQFGTEDYDPSSCFNNGTGVYTPGISSGYVSISATILGSFAISGTDRYKLSIRRNGTILTTKYLIFQSGTVDQSASIDGQFSFSANTDTFDIYLENLNAAAFNTAATAQGTSFYARIIA